MGREKGLEAVVGRYPSSTSWCWGAQTPLSNISHVSSAMMLSQIHVAARRSLSTATTSHRIPWFVSPDEPDFPLDVRRRVQPQTLPTQSTSQLLPLPEDTPDHLRKLHHELSTSPYLETSTLVVTRPVEPPAGPPLPFLRSKGSRRKRGGTDAGIGIDVPGNGLWSWFVFAQVKEGTEGKNSINSVVKAVRKTLGQLASNDPSLALPPNRKQSPTDGWAMLDVGDFAVHILSRAAREKWFPTTADDGITS